MDKPVTVAFLGPEGTYTHQAVMQQFGNDPERVKILPQSSIQACFDQIHDETVDYAVVPLENSTNGLVVFTYDLLRDWFVSTEAETTPKFRIVAEQFVVINHYLFSRAADLSQVCRLYSHPQVWGQISDFLKHQTFNGNYSKIDTSSTARAAEMVYEDQSCTSACISSEMSGILYHLPTKAAEIEDMKGNTTRFLVLGHGGMLKSEEADTSGDNQRNVCMTLLVFVLTNDDPGALCEALNAFKVNGVNLTSIASRPSKMAPWDYVFFVEAEGATDREKLRKSLLQRHCLKVAILGLFMRSWRYKKQ